MEPRSSCLALREAREQRRATSLNGGVKFRLPSSSTLELEEHSLSPSFNLLSLSGYWVVRLPPFLIVWRPTNIIPGLVQIDLSLHNSIQSISGSNDLERRPLLASWTGDYWLPIQLHSLRLSWGGYPSLLGKPFNGLSLDSSVASGTTEIQRTYIQAVLLN